MKRCIITVTLILGMGLTSAKAQTVKPQTEKKEVKIGEQVPDIEFNNIVNWHKTSAKLSDFKGKLVILDFWATWCSPCVGALPKLDSLQREFKDEVVILPVSNERTEVVLKMLKENTDLKDFKLPSVTNIGLGKYFPHKSVPHEVWIDQQGKLLATTAGEEVTAENIRKVLKKDTVKLKEKKDIMNERSDKPIYLGGAGSYEMNADKIEFSSFFYPYIQGLNSRASFPFILGNQAKMGGRNIGVQSLYQMTFAPYPIDTPVQFYLHLNSRLLWEAKDKFLFFNIKEPKKDFPTEALFNYELIVPKSEKKSISNYMLQDLNRYFGMRYGIVGSLEERNVNCWALLFSKDLQRFISKGGKPSLIINQYTKEIKAVNQSIDEILTAILIFYGPAFPEPFINATNFKSPIDIEIKADPTNFLSVKEALSKLGFRFEYGKKKIKMIVIKDLPKGK